MAPTEILAHQHFEGLRKSFAAHGIRVGFLSGSLKASEKREILEQLKDGQIDILVGAHASDTARKWSLPGLGACDHR